MSVSSSAAETVDLNVDGASATAIDGVVWRGRRNEANSVCMIQQNCFQRGSSLTGLSAVAVLVLVDAGSIETSAGSYLERLTRDRDFRSFRRLFFDFSFSSSFFPRDRLRPFGGSGMKITALAFATSECIPHIEFFKFEQFAQPKAHGFSAFSATMAFSDLSFKGIIGNFSKLKCSFT